MFNDLKKVLQYISTKIDETQIDGKFRELATLYEQARTNPSEEVTTNIDRLKSELDEIQVSIEPSNFDAFSAKIFYKFDKTGYLGRKGIEQFYERTQSLGVDLFGASGLMNEFADNIATLNSKAKEGLKSLENILDDAQVVPENTQKIQLIFQEAVKIDDFSALSEQSKDWELLFKIASQVFPNGQTTPTFLSIHKASPTVMVILATINISMLIGGGVLLALKIKEKMLNIKLLSLQIEKAELEKDQAMQTLLKEQIEATLQKHLKNAVMELLESNKTAIANGNMNVAKVASEMLLKQIYNFTVKGGQVTIINENSSEDDNGILNLNKKFNEVNRLSKSLDSPELPLLGISEEEKEKFINDNALSLEKKPPTKKANTNISSREKASS